MSSFTSSSKAALAALGVVFATLILCELSLRFLERSISIDVAHLRSIPTIAERLAAGDGQRVLFLGSSIVREGVDLNTVRRAVRGSGWEPLTIDKVHPDDSRVVEWTHLVEHHFINAELSPDVIVIGFADTHLEDDNRIPWDRIGAYYTSTPNLARIITKEIDDFGTSAQFVLAHFLRTFAHRERVGKRVLDFVVPHYRKSSRRINSALRREELEATVSQERRYAWVQRLAELTRRNGVTLVLLAMPLRYSWEITPELRRRTSELNVKLIDARDIPGMDNQSYKDSMHMNALGAEQFSKWLLDLLAPVLLEASGQTEKAIDDFDIGPTA